MSTQIEIKFVNARKALAYNKHSNISHTIIIVVILPYCLDLTSIFVGYLVWDLILFNLFLHIASYWTGNRPKEGAREKKTHLIEQKI